MKRKDEFNPRRFWKWRISLFVLVLHTFLYAFIWVFALSGVINLEYILDIELITVTQRQVVFALAWMLVLCIHAGLHFFFAGRADAGMSELQIYQEGFRDGARHANYTDDDEAAFSEFGMKEKQKRGE